MQKKYKYLEPNVYPSSPTPTYNIPTAHFPCSQPNHSKSQVKTPANGVGVGVGQIERMNG